MTDSTGGTDTELEGGRLVTDESGGIVLEETLVLLGGITSVVDESESLELVDVAGGGGALELLLLSGVTTQVLSSLTVFVPSIRVRVIVHV